MLHKFCLILNEKKAIIHQMTQQGIPIQPPTSLPVNRNQLKTQIAKLQKETLAVQDDVSDSELISSQVRLNTLQFLHSQQVSKQKVDLASKSKPHPLPQQPQLQSKHSPNMLSKRVKALKRQTMS